MRRLLLFRHARSSWPAGVGDHERPLAARGRHASSAMGRFMAGKGMRPDLVLVSTSERTRETWKRASRAFGRDVPHSRQDGRIYEATAEALLGIVRQAKNSARTLMLVGHNPGFEDLSGMLVGSGEPTALSRLREKFPTAAIAAIDFDVDDWSGIAAGRGRLIRFDTPKSVAG